ncbi:PREDICTED: adenosine receptor A3-like [Nanorana parkeri]|uniref:adenosine receptor A3-like n=1 Tax=Nanorana parkeri TaxID=125878 RepID=UPI0008550545|nr:PREDICTED: adenosine receptor A3-like [Nanorana parkeri]
MSNQTPVTDSLILYMVVEAVIGIFAIMGNTLVIWAVKRNPALQYTTFYFIVSLAVADLAVGALVMPLAIILTLEIQMYFHACLFICCVIIMMTNASILSLLAIALDRYMRIKVPNRYRNVVTKKRTSICIFVSWILSAAGALVPMFGWNNRSRLFDEENSNFTCTFPSVMRYDFLVFFCFFGWVLIPLFAMTVLYIKIFQLIRKHMKKNISGFQEKTFSYVKEHKTTSFLFLIMGLFAICWLPISILNCVTYFYPPVVQSGAFQPILFLSILLSHLNSVMNPIIYTLKIKKFKRAEEEARQLVATREMEYVGEPSETTRRVWRDAAAHLETLLKQKSQRKLFFSKRVFWAEGDATGKLLPQQDTVHIGAVMHPTGATTQVPELILDTFSNFYKSLYTSRAQYTEDELESFLGSITLPALAVADRAALEEPIYCRGTGAGISHLS